MCLTLTSEHSGTATLAAVSEPAHSTVQVEVRVGDDLIGEAPRVIKIDVEGFEFSVLKGLRRTIDEHKPFLITELIESHLRRAGASVNEVAQFLVGRGYEAYEIHAWRKRRFLRVDLVLVPIDSRGAFPIHSDVLWMHRDRRIDLSRFFPRSV